MPPNTPEQDESPLARMTCLEQCWVCGARCDKERDEDIQQLELPDWQITVTWGTYSKSVTMPACQREAEEEWRTCTPE